MSTTMTMILNSALAIVKFAFGKGGVLVFVSKNLALTGVALFFHHDNLGEAAQAVSPFVLMLVGDAVWYLGLILLQKRDLIRTCVADAFFRGQSRPFRVATTGDA